MVLTRPSVGVVPPPFARFAQSSSLSAPPLTALYSTHGVFKIMRKVSSKIIKMCIRDGRFNGVDTDFNDEGLRYYCMSSGCGQNLRTVVHDGHVGAGKS